MRRSMISVLAVLASAAAFASGFGLKPGLWELRVSKQVTDGHDVAAQMATAGAQMEQMLANMPAEQRARVQAMMKQTGTSGLGTGTARMCITPEMASRDTPIVDREGHCQPTSINRSGNRTTFEVSCKTQGGEMTGKGESVSSGDVISMKLDSTLRATNGATHVTHSETELKYLGADCGDIKPITPPKSG